MYNTNQLKTNANILTALCILIMFISIFIASNPFASSLSNTSYSGGGLSVESVDIAEENLTDLIRDTNKSANEIGGGLSVESVDIAKEQ
jgi:hypothetical protein